LEPDFLWIGLKTVGFNHLAQGRAYRGPSAFANGSSQVIREVSLVGRERQIIRVSGVIARERFSEALQLAVQPGADHV
jgi:hypothetical protein